jgi:hypothetical protein
MNEITEDKQTRSFVDELLGDDSEVPQSSQEQPAAGEIDLQRSIPEPRGGRTVLPEEIQPISSGALEERTAGGYKDTNSSAKPVSERKRAANRENAKFSTGPTTAKGKATSSSNSTKHGIFSRNLIRQGEQQENDEAAFKEIQDRIAGYYQPVGDVEKLIVEKIVVETQRFSRLLAYERTELNREYAFWGPAVDRVLRYQATINRQLFQAMEQLERIRLRAYRSSILGVQKDRVRDVAQTAKRTHRTRIGRICRATQFGFSTWAPLRVSMRGKSHSIDRVEWLFRCV